VVSSDAEDTDGALCSQDDEARRFAAADKALAALVAAQWPKKTDATHDLDGVFMRPEIHCNTDKKVDEEMWGCLVCM
jgi:hypothetical protein